MDSLRTTDISFLRRLKGAADEGAWVQFHEQYGELLYRYARRRGATHYEAEEIVQEVELYVFKAMPGFDYDPHKGRFRSYLRTALLNCLSQRSKRRARQEASISPRNLEQVRDPSDPDSEAWEREWRAHRLRWALRVVAGDFAPVTMESFRLYALEGRSVSETAQILGVSRLSVYQAKSRVLRRLRQYLRQVGGVVD